MTPLVVEATYESGVLKLDERLPLKEPERVTVTLHTAVNPDAPARDCPRWHFGLGCARSCRPALMDRG